MKLTIPTDFDILEALSDRRRSAAVSPSYVFDKNRSYINTRLPILADYGLLAWVRSASNSGLYETTDKGLAILDNRDQCQANGVDFDALVESGLRARTDEANA